MAARRRRALSGRGQRAALGCGPGFAARLKAVGGAHGIAPDCIEIELSESKDLAHYPGMNAIVSRLRGKGVNIAMNDFGTGYACLAALAPIDFGTVKVAKELLNDAPCCPNAGLVFSSVLDLLTRLKVAVVAEGVETPAQAQWLAQWPHVMAQGFFLARPAFGIGKVPGAQLADAVTRHRMRRHEHRMRFVDAA